MQIYYLCAALRRARDSPKYSIPVAYKNICFVRYLVREIYVFRNICFYMPTFMLHEMLSTSEIHVLFVGGSGKGHNCNDIYIQNNKHCSHNTICLLANQIHNIRLSTGLCIDAIHMVGARSQPCSWCTSQQFFSLSCYISYQLLAKRQSSSGHHPVLQNLQRTRPEGFQRCRRRL